MSTQKDIIAYCLFRYIAQRADDLARKNGFPAASVRRVLRELVEEGRAIYVAKDLFGFPGYLKPRQPAVRG